MFYRTAADVEVLAAGNCLCDKTHWCVEAEFVTYFNRNSSGFSHFKSSWKLKMAHIVDAIEFNSNAVLIIIYCAGTQEIMLISPTVQIEPLLTSTIKRFNFEELPIENSNDIFSVVFGKTHGLFPMYKSMVDSTPITHLHTLEYNSKKFTIYQQSTELIRN